MRLPAGFVLCIAIFGIASPAFAADSKPRVVLGLDHTSARPDMKHLEKAFGGPSYQTWKKRGFLVAPSTRDTGRRPEDGWTIDLRQALHHAVNKGGRIAFDLTGVDLDRALSLENRRHWTKHNVTAWEIQQIRKNPTLFSHTDFYKHDGTKYQLLMQRSRSVTRPVTDVTGR